MVFLSHSLYTVRCQDLLIFLLNRPLLCFTKLSLPPPSIFLEDYCWNKSSCYLCSKIFSGPLFSFNSNVHFSAWLQGHSPSGSNDLSNLVSPHMSLIPAVFFTKSQNASQFHFVLAPGKPFTSNLASTSPNHIHLSRPLLLLWVPPALTIWNTLLLASHLLILAPFFCVPGTNWTWSSKTGLTVPWRWIQLLPVQNKPEHSLPTPRNAPQLMSPHNLWLLIALNSYSGLVDLPLSSD